MSRGTVQDCFGAPPATLPPSVPVRRWDEAALYSGFVGVCTYAFLSFATWHEIPLLGERPDLSLPEWMLWVLDVRSWNDAPLELVARAAIVATGTLVLALWSGAYGLRPQTRIRHISGPRLLQGIEAEKAARHHAARERGKSEAFLTLHPALSLPKTRWTRHLMLFGSVGSGKTVVLLPIVQQLVDKRIKAFVYDVKGDMTAKFPDAALVSPWDSRSRVWDIGRDVRTPSEAATFAAALIPAGPEHGGNQYFAIAAQQLLLGAVLSLQDEFGSKWGCTDLARRSSASQADFLKTLQAHYPKAAPLIADGSASATSSVLATLAAYTRVIDDLAVSWGNGEGKKKVSLREWVRDDYRGRPMIIVQGGPDRALTSAYIGAMVKLLESMVVSPALPDDELGRSLVFVLDELPSLRVDVSSLVDKGRSKGCVVIAGLQDPIQLRESLGADKAAALMSMVGMHVVCRIQMGDSREQIAAMFGRERVAVLASSSGAGAGGTSSSLAVHEETRAVVESHVLSSDLGVQKKKRKDWPQGIAIRALVSLGGDVWMLDFPGAVPPNRQPGFVPAPWTLPQSSEGKQSPHSSDQTEAMPSGTLRANGAALAALSAAFAAPSDATHATFTPPL